MPRAAKRGPRRLRRPRGSRSARERVIMTPAATGREGQWRTRQIRLCVRREPSGHPRGVARRRLRAERGASAAGRQDPAHRLARLQLVEREPRHLRPGDGVARVGRRQDLPDRVPRRRGAAGAPDRRGGRIDAAARRRHRRAGCGRGARGAPGHRFDPHRDDRGRRSGRARARRELRPAGRQRHRPRHRARRARRQAALAAARVPPARDERRGDRRRDGSASTDRRCAT